MPNFPCSSCEKNVNNNHRAIQCDICDKCNFLNNKDYDNLKKSDDPFFCIKCYETILPFCKLTDKEFIISIINGVTGFNNETEIDFLPPSQMNTILELNNFINQKLNSLSDNKENEEDDTSPINCIYYNIDEFTKANFNPSKSFSILHLNIHSVKRHIEELKIIINLLNFKFDVIALSESKIQKGTTPIIDISLEGYQSPIGTPTEATKGGVLLYISNKLNFKPRPDLNIYQAKRVESIFVEIVNKNKSNDIVGVVYRHPSMCEEDFNENLLRNLVHKLSNEKNKNTYIAGDFNFDLIKVSSHQATADFYDLLSSNFLLPMILLPTKINSVTDTLIDNTFTNLFDPNTVSGKLT